MLRSQMTPFDLWFFGQWVKARLFDIFIKVNTHPEAAEAAFLLIGKSVSQCRSQRLDRSGMVLLIDAPRELGRQGIGIGDRRMDNQGDDRVPISLSSVSFVSFCADFRNALAIASLPSPKALSAALDGPLRVMTLCAARLSAGASVVRARRQVDHRRSSVPAGQCWSTSGRSRRRDNPVSIVLPSTQLPKLAFWRALLGPRDEPLHQYDNHDYHNRDYHRRDREPTLALTSIAGST